MARRGAVRMAPVRFLADEMLGRLARYLRMVGYDTFYARGEADEAIAERAVREDRQLLTRDRRLARQVPGSVLLVSVELAEQLRELDRALPGLTWEPNPRWCTLCNGQLRLALALPGPRSSSPEGASDERPVWDCVACGHRYWEGSHSERLRTDLRRWLSREGA